MLSWLPLLSNEKIAIIFIILLLICVLPLTGFKIFLFVFGMLQFSLLCASVWSLYLFILLEFAEFFSSVD